MRALHARATARRAGSARHADDGDAHFGIVSVRLRIGNAADAGGFSENWLLPVAGTGPPVSSRM